MLQRGGGLGIFILLPIDLTLPTAVNLAFQLYVRRYIISLERLLIGKSERWRRSRTRASFQ